jgi:hypothetical protein
VSAWHDRRSARKGAQIDARKEPSKNVHERAARSVLRMLLACLEQASPSQSALHSLCLEFDVLEIRLDGGAVHCAPLVDRFDCVVLAYILAGMDRVSHDEDCPLAHHSPSRAKGCYDDDALENATSWSQRLWLLRRRISGPSSAVVA